MLKILALYRRIILLENELAEARAEIARLKAQKPSRRHVAVPTATAVPDLDTMTNEQMIAFINGNLDAVSDRLGRTR